MLLVSRASFAACLSPLCTPTSPLTTCHVCCQPDTKNVANIFGLQTTDKLVRTLWGDPDDPLWQSR